jgi:hypothetical protein
MSDSRHVEPQRSRDHTQIVGGYVDVDPGEYADFTNGWVRAAAAAIRPAGQLAVVIGPQRAGVVQCTAEEAGLTWVSSIVARRTFRSRLCAARRRLRALPKLFGDVHDDAAMFMVMAPVGRGQVMACQVVIGLTSNGTAS